MDTEDLSFNDSTNTKVVKYFGAVLPRICIAVFSDGFIIESIDSGDLSGLVVTSQEGDVSGILEFQTEQKLEGLN
jgi:hypothetical protein